MGGDTLTCPENNCNGTSWTNIWTGLTLANLTRDAAGWFGKGFANRVIAPSAPPLVNFAKAADKPFLTGVPSEDTAGGSNKKIYDGGEFSLRKHAKHAKKMADRQKKLKEIYGGDYEKHL